MKLEISVVIPVYNEEAALAKMFCRLYPALDALGLFYEVVFVNDGSRDRSAAILADQFRRRPDVTRVMLFDGNYNHHMAILAGFEATALLFLLLLLRRFLLGAEVEGLFTLFAINFFLLGVILFGIGLIGEYVGRIYQQVRGRARYVVQAILQDEPARRTLLEVSVHQP
jgi:hypothetical protein